MPKYQFLLQKLYGIDGLVEVDAKNDEDAYNQLYDDVIVGNYDDFLKVRIGDYGLAEDDTEIMNMGEFVGTDDPLYDGDMPLKFGAFRLEHDCGS